MNTVRNGAISFSQFSRQSTGRFLLLNGKWTAGDSMCPLDG